MTITISTDGSALGNPNGPMGWAWADHTPHAGGTTGHEHPGDCDAGGATNGTNQIGELCAVLEALRAHPGDEPLIIETDSQYAINCSTKWVQGWKRNGWKNAQKKPVKNAALIKAIDAELARRGGSVRFVWVKGHAGNAGNEKVDDLARTYAGDCRSGVRDGYLPLEGWQSLLASEYAKGTDVPEDARMLMDGRISAAQYHLGRGEDSDADVADARGGTGCVSDSSAAKSAHSAGSTRPTRSAKRSLIDALAEPEGVPGDLAEYNPLHDVDTAASSGLPDHDRSADAAETASDAVDVSSDASVQRRTGALATSAHSDTAQSTPAVQSAAAIQPSAATQPAAAHQSNAAAQQNTATAMPSAQSATVASGLTVSGTLRFSPPPSSSPTYDGTPRMIRGTVAVEGYVNGDGTITLTDAPFAIRRA